MLLPLSGLRERFFCCIYSFESSSGRGMPNFAFWGRLSAGAQVRMGGCSGIHR